MLKYLNEFISITYNMRTTKIENNKNDTLAALLSYSFNGHLILMQHLKYVYSDSKKVYFGFNIKALIPRQTA
ncbi:unnamed protein product [Blepharisma stoltei]|uniref:Uncharacterized protein n=1 Tax=Blepharisma stoltei TaxID=1481888 RepID=A0AAU9JQ29_9CILI|nr:unnamed protein product [Blepharisma stoltei]